jgi:hypothetical protein
MKRLFLILILCLVGGLLVWGIMEGRKEIGMEAERDQPVNAPSRFKDDVITLDEQARAAAGIEITSIKDRQIPASAIIWWEGNPSIYIQQTPDTYVRVVNPEGNTTVAQPIVTTGTQLLLSEELRSGLHVGEEK